MKTLLKSPWLELTTMSVVVILSFAALMLITKGAETPPGGMSLNSISLLTFGFFLLSFAIAAIAVVAGIGGGVLFTPLMLAFTPVDSLIVRGTEQLAHQHCPTMLDNGNILVFDNGMHPKGFAFSFSKVLEVNPKTNEVVWQYGGREVMTQFYSSTLGSCQRLPDGNTLICEGITGRIFEVNPSSELVLEFANNLPSYEPYPAQTRSHMVCSAYRYGLDYSGLKEPVSQPIERQAAPGTMVEEMAAVKARLEQLGY